MKLYAALNESPGALREWLLQHEQSESFNPMGDAPATSALRVMVRKSKPEFVQVLDDLIREDETLEASSDLVDVTGLSDVMMARGVEWPGPKLLGVLLERDGYEALGRVKLGGDSYHYFYSKSPELFRDGTYTSGTKVKAFMDQRRVLLQERENEL